MKKGFGFLAVIVSAIIFGCLPLIAKVIYSNGGNPFSVIFYRFFLPLPLLWVLSERLEKNNMKITKEELKQLIIVSLCGYGITALLVFSSYNYISTGVATTLHFTYPIFVTLGITIVYKEKPDFLKIICIILCTIGVILFLNDVKVDNMLGIVLSLLSGVTYAFYILYIDKSILKNLNTFKLTFYLGLISSIFIFIISVATKQFVFKLTPVGWGATIILSIVASVVGFSLFNFGIKTVGSQNASIFSTFEPITSVIIGIFVFNEPFNLQILIGGILIIASVLITVYSENRRYRQIEKIIKKKE